ncbi:CREM protein, partial [Alcedo cyanopectus]|nr:CREM protein [Ceyx cyanopectus]
MTMEMVESQQDDSAVDSVPEGDADHLQNPSGQSCLSPRPEVSAAAAGRRSPAVTLLRLPSAPAAQAQAVILATEPSVIQPALQVALTADEPAESGGVIDSQKRREILSRRPSYRKILNELSSDSPDIARIEEEEKSEDEEATSEASAMTIPADLYHTNTGQYITVAQSGAIQVSNSASDDVHGLQALTMTNSGAPQPGATIVQYAGQCPDGTQQFFVPGSQVVVQGISCCFLLGGFCFTIKFKILLFATAATGDMPAYQIRTPTTALPQGVVMAATTGTLHSPQQLAEEATRKRELRLMKNRQAAKECRRRKKEYIKCLESRVAVLEVQNKKLIQELETLKALCSSETD